MTDTITIDDLIKMKEQFNRANVPAKGRGLIMSKDSLKDWCEATGLKWEDIKHKDLGHGIVEVGL
jgi:hypothetical protein